MIKAKSDDTVKQYDSSVRKLEKTMARSVLQVSGAVEAAEVITKFKKCKPSQTQVACIRATMGIIFEARTGGTLADSRLVKIAAGIVPAEAKYRSIFPFEMIIAKWKQNACTNKTQKRTRAIIALAYGFNLRAVDLMGLQVQLPLKSDVMTIRYSPKHLRKKGGKKQWWTTSVHMKDTPAIKICEWVQAWHDVCNSRLIVTAAGKRYWIVATIIAKEERPEELAKTTIANTMKHAMKESGVDIDVYKPHSFKAAIVSMKFRMGFSIERIAFQGKHSSEKTLKKHYLLPTDPVYRGHERFSKQHIQERADKE